MEDMEAKIILPVVVLPANIHVGETSVADKCDWDPVEPKVTLGSGHL